MNYFNKPPRYQISRQSRSDKKRTTYDNGERVHRLGELFEDGPSEFENS